MCDVFFFGWIKLIYYFSSGMQKHKVRANAGSLEDQCHNISPALSQLLWLDLSRSADKLEGGLMSQIEYI